MASFNLLHISDLHIARFPWMYLSYDPKKALALAQFAAHHAHEFDAILVSGDLAETGAFLDLAASRDFLFGDVGAGKTYLTDKDMPTMQGARRPIYIVPGNNDRYSDPLNRIPGARLFEQVFSQEWQVGAWGVQSTRIALKDSNYTVVLIAADCSLQSNADASNPFDAFAVLGQGRAYESVVDGLEQMTVAARAKDSSICVPVWVRAFSARDRPGAYRIT